jgi:hypothetical protein
MGSESEVIERLSARSPPSSRRRGLDPDDRITITTEAHELIPGRRASRARVKGFADPGRSHAQTRVSAGADFALLSA